MSDKRYPLGDGSGLVKLKDMGDGTHAKVVQSATSSAAAVTDKLVAAGDGSIKKRLRNMGDGTFAEVKFGV